MWDKPLVLKLLNNTSILELSNPRAAWENGPVPPCNAEIDDKFVNLRMPGHESSDWWGAPTGTEAFRRMNEGWPEGLAAIRKAMSLVDVPILPKRKRARYGMDGEVDIERFLFTEPEPFRQHAKIMAPVIKLTVDIGADWTTSAEQLKWRGAACVTIAEILTNAGFSVEIIAVSLSRNQYYGTGRPSKSLTLLKLKDAQAPINLSILAGTLFTTAGFRIAMWRGWYHAPWPIADNHGHTIELPETLWGDIFIPATIFSQKDAQEFLSSLPTCRRSDLKQFILKGGR